MCLDSLASEKQKLRNSDIFQSIDPKNDFPLSCQAHFDFFLRVYDFFCVFIISKLWKILLFDDWAMPDLEKSEFRCVRLAKSG